MNLCLIKKWGCIGAVSSLLILSSSSVYAQDDDVADDSVVDVSEAVEQESLAAESISSEDDSEDDSEQVVSDSEEGDEDSEGELVASDVENEAGSETVDSAESGDVVAMDPVADTVVDDTVQEEALTQPDVVDEATEVAEADTAEAEEAESKPWSVSGSLRTVVGQGTFVKPSNDTQWAGSIDDGSNAYNRVNMGGSVSASYQLGDFNVGAGISFVQWLTAGGGANAPQEFRFQDLGLSGSWKGYTIESIGVHLSPSLSVTLPTSARSRVETLLFDTSLSLGISKRFFDKLTVAYSLSGTKNFHEYKSPVLPMEKIGVENLIYREGEEVQPGRIAIDGYNTEYSLGNSLSLSYSIIPKLTASVSYGFYNSWSYHFENDDEFTSEYARTGRGWGQITSTSIGLSYGIYDWLSVRGGISTAQPPKTSDQKSYRFPFWNFSGAAYNFSSMSLSVSASY